jgi:NADH-quinone oxidoreductase subunit C
MLKDLAELINKNVPAAKLEHLTPENGDHSLLVTDSTKLHEVIKFCRDNNEISFNSLQVVSGVDFLEYIEVNYMLANFDMDNPRTVIIKVHLKDRVEPKVDSVVDLYAAANFQERECYDMFGVNFTNHPDHRRILCPYDWEGYPLRKDYMATRYYNGMEVFPDDKMNMFEREYIIHEKAEVARKKAEAAAQAENSGDK